MTKLKPFQQARGLGVDPQCCESIDMPHYTRLANFVHTFRLFGSFAQKLLALDFRMNFARMKFAAHASIKTATRASFFSWPLFFFPTYWYVFFSSFVLLFLFIFYTDDKPLN